MTFRTEIQKLLFTNELSGQISDGQWENTRPHDHWENWCNAEILVGDNVGRDFSTIKDNYNLNSKDLLDVVGQRMINMIKVKKALPGLPDDVCESIGDYGIEQLKKYASENASNNEYWQKKLEEVLMFATEEQLKAALAADSYNMKDLQKDLKEMKKAMKVVL